MSQNRQWIPLEEGITAYMDRAELSNHKYFKLFHIAFEFMQDAGLDAFYLVRSVKIPVNANLTAPLPADYLQYSKVGVFNEIGEIITMGVNNNLSVAFDLSPNRIQQTQDGTIVNYYNPQGVWWFNFWNGSGIVNLYGLPSGAPFIGSFKIDNANGVIVLSENFSYPYVVLEYVSSPNPSGEYYIPVQFRTALVAYLSWQDIAHVPSKTHVQNSNAEMRRRNYYNELRKSKYRYDPINIPDLYQWSMENQRMTVKS